MKKIRILALLTVIFSLILSVCACNASTYTVGFNLGYAGGEAPADMTAVSGSEIELPAGPVRDGYVFLGWAADKTGEPSTGKYKVTQSVIMYAVWQGNEYNLTLKDSGKDDVKVRCGEALTLPPPAQRTGYDFEGWFDGDKEYKTGDSMPAQNLELTARFAPKAFVALFDLGDGTNFRQKIYYDGVVTRPKNPESNDGKVFVYWYLLDEEEEIQYDFSTKITGDVKLYAKWSETDVEVVFELGDGRTERLVTEKGKPLARPIDPTRDGYDFVVWYTKNGVIELEYDFDAPVTGALTLYARWEALNYTLTLELGYGMSPITSEIEYDQILETPEEPHSPGRKFLYWYIMVGGQKIQFAFGGKVTGDLTLYAEWSEEFQAYFYTNFMVEGFENNEAKIVLVNGDFTVTEQAAPRIPESGDIFTGWYSDAECTRKIDFKTFKATEPASYFYAGWQAPAFTRYLYFDFLLSRGTYVVSKKEGVTLPSTVIIPSSYRGVAVKAIGAASMVGNEIRGGFSGSYEMTSLVLPVSVTDIKDYAFYECTSLKDIDLGRVEKIGRYAFACDVDHYAQIEDTDKRLGTLTLPASLISTDSNAFRNCRFSVIDIEEGSNLTTLAEYTFSVSPFMVSINLPEGLTSIGSCAFNGCRSLETIEIPSTAVISVGDTQIFQNCIALTSVIFKSGSSMVDLPSYTFRWCESLSELTLPGDVENIYPGAFYQAGLSHFTLPKSVRIIGEKAFEACGLETIEFAEGSKLREIYNSAFLNCIRIQSISIPEGVTKMGSSVFYGCSELTSVHLPGTLNEMYSQSLFAFCFKLRTLTVAPANLYYKSVNDNAVYTANGLTLFAVAPAAAGDFTVAAAVTAVSPYAMFCCNKLTSITLPEGLKEIGEGAFGADSEKNALTVSLVIPSGVTSIGSYAFAYMTDVTFAENSAMTVLGDYSFAYYHGSTVNLPVSVTTIGEGAFAWTKNLSEVVIDGVSTLGKSAFFGTPSLKRITLPETLTEIGDFAFAGSSQEEFLSGLVSVRIPAAVTTIGQNAFSGCPFLTTLTIAENSKLASIGARAFYQAGITSLDLSTAPHLRVIDLEAFREAKLTEIIWADRYDTVDSDGALTQDPEKIYDGLKIWHGAFYLCDGLTELCLPEGLVFIGESAFYGLIDRPMKLGSVTLPATLSIISAGAFYRCEELTSLHIPSAVQAIGQAAFAECYKLEKVELGENSKLSIIVYDAFKNCHKLTSFTIPRAYVDIDENKPGAFLRNCDNLEKITVQDGNPNYYVVDDDLYYLDTATGMVTLALVPAAKTGKYTVNESVEVIAMYSMIQSRISELIVGDNVIEIKTAAFDDNRYIKKIVFTDAPGKTLLLNKRIFFGAALEEAIFGKRAYELMGYTFQTTALKNVILPSDMKNVPDGMFYGCSELLSVKLPDSLVSIGKYAFAGYGDHYIDKLIKIVIPAAVNFIDESAFSNNGVEEIVFAENSKLKTISKLAFAYNHNIVTFDVPESVKEIGQQAFADSSIRFLILNSLLPPAATSDIFYKCEALEKIYVPFKQGDTYRRANGWKAFAEKIVEMD